MAGEVEKAPQLPLAVLLVVAFVSAITLALAMRRLNSMPGAFLLLAVWLRIISGAFYTFTFAPIAGGLSINALLSVTMVCAGILIVDTRTFRQIWMVPIYFLLAIVLVSTVINGTVSGAIDMIFKWGYMVVVIAATKQSMQKHGRDLLLYMIIWCYAPIFVFQILSLVLGYGKDTEGSNALSYIGGYMHEAAFSIMIATFATVVFLTSRMSFVSKALFLLLTVLAVLLANYRTAILAMMPVLAGFVFVEGLSRFDRKSRAFVGVMLIPIVLIGVIFGADKLGERFSDLGTMFTEYERFMKPAAQFSSDDQKVMSGRLYIWSMYLTGYAGGSDLQLLFGYGPNSWVGVIWKYAHNTLVSYVYELGPLGAIALVIIWATFLYGTLRITDAVMRNKLLLAQAGFFLFNLATMPHWMIEGIVLYALIQGTVLFQLSAQGVRYQPPEQEYQIQPRRIQRLPAE